MTHRRTYTLFRKTKTKIVNTTASLVLVATSMGGAIPLLLSQKALALGSVVMPSNASAQGWATQDGAPSYVAGPSGADGHGSLEFATGPTGNDKENYFHAASTPLNGISGLGYKVDVTAGVPASYQLQVLGVHRTDSASTFTSLVWEPVYNGQGNGPNGGFVSETNLENGVWWSSHPIDGDPAGVNGFVHLSDIISANPGATIVAYGINVGSGTPNANSYVDDVSFQGNVTNFETDPPAAPTALYFTHTGSATPLACGAVVNTYAGATLHWTAPAGSLQQYAVTPTYPDAHGQYTYYPAGSATSVWIGDNFGHHGEGTYSYAIEAQNTAGQWSPVATCSLVYDTSAPVVSVTPVPGSSLHGTVTFDITVHDANPQPSTTGWVYLYNTADTAANHWEHQTGQNVTITNGHGTFTVDTTTSKTPDGNYDLAVYELADAAGNVTRTQWGPSSSYFDNYTIDNTAPTAPSITAPINNSYTANLPKVTWTSVTDNLSNPVTYIYQSSNSNVVNQDGSFATPVYTSNPLSQNEIPTPGTPPGVYYLHVQAVDAAGNKGAWSTTVKVTVDNTNPLAAITSPSSGQVVSVRGTGNKLNITGTASDSDFNYYYCYVTNSNGNEVGTRSSQCVTAWALGTPFESAFAQTAQGTTNGSLGYVNMAGLSNGNYTVHLVAKDKAGNTSEATQPFYLDNTAPTVGFTAPTPADGTYVNSDFGVGFTAHDNVALKSVDVSLFDNQDPNHLWQWKATCYSNGAVNAADLSQTCTVHLPNSLPDGTYTLKVGAQDTAGNWSVNATRTIYIQRSAPAQPTNLQVKYQYDSSYVSNGSTLWQSAKPSGNNLELTWNDVAGDWVTGHDIKVTYPNGTTDSFHQGPNTNSWLAVFNNFGKEGNGSYVYSVVADNPNGTSIPSSTFTLYYDTQSPTASFTQTPPTYVNSNFWVYGTASDNVALSDAFFDVRDASGWVAGCAPGTFTSNPSPIKGSKTATLSCQINTSNLVDGNTYTLRVHDGDMTNHYGGGSQVSITVDRVAPTITVKPGYVGDATQKIFSNVSFKLHDNNAVDYYTVNGHKHDVSNGPWSDANYQNIKGQLTQGQNTIVLYDVAGNSSSYTFTYDSTAPFHPTNLEVNGQSGTFYTKVGAPFTQTWQESAKSKDVVSYNYVSCYVSTMPTSSTCPGTSYSNSYGSASKQVNSGDTKHDEIFFWQVQAVDAAGNTSGWSTWSEVVVDSTKPHVSGSTEPSINPSSFTITATDATPGSGIDSIAGNVYKYDQTQSKYVLFQGHNSSTDNPFTVDLSTLADGTYYVKYNAHDKSGNTSNTEEFNFTVDHTAPTVTINGYGQTGNVIQPHVTATDTNAPLTYSWVANDAASASNVSIAGSTAREPLFTVHADGTYSFTLTATDPAGNASTAIFSFTYTTPPTPPTTPATPAFTAATATNPGTGTGTGTGTTTPLTDNGTGATAVLGDTTTKSSSVKGDSIDLTNSNSKDKTSNSSNFLGLGWWWLLILAAIIAGLWWFLAARRADEE